VRFFISKAGKLLSTSCRSLHTQHRVGRSSIIRMTLRPQIHCYSVILRTFLAFSSSPDNVIKPLPRNDGKTGVFRPHSKIKYYIRGASSSWSFKFVGLQTRGASSSPLSPMPDTPTIFTSTILPIYSLLALKNTFTPLCVRPISRATSFLLTLSASVV
jgi:hypothetical protein